MVRFNAVDILRGCAGDARDAIPALCDLLGRESEATVRAQCAWGQDHYDDFDLFECFGNLLPPADSTNHVCGVLPQGDVWMFLGESPAQLSRSGLSVRACVGDEDARGGFEWVGYAAHEVLPLERLLRRQLRYESQRYR